jgi:hypothetical protein
VCDGLKHQKEKRSRLIQRNMVGANREAANVAVTRFERADHPTEYRLVIMFGMAVVDMLVQHDAKKG